MTVNPGSSATYDVSRMFRRSCLLLAAFAIAIYGIGAQSFWYDEVYSVMLAQRGMADVIVQTASLDFNTPLHYLTLTAWTAGAGTGEFAARLLSVCATIIGAALAAACFKRGRTAALAAVALSPMLISVAQEARMYALVTLFCTLACFAWLRATRRNRTRDWLLWAAACLLAFGAHILGAAVFGAQTLAWIALWLRRRSTFPGAYRAPLVASALAAMPMLAFVGYILSFGNRYAVAFDSRLPLADTLLRSAAAWSLPQLEPAAWVSGFALISLAMLGVALRSPGWRTAALSVIGVCAIAAVCAATGKFGQRYPAIVAPPAIAAFGAALGVWFGKTGWRRALSPLIAAGYFSGAVAGAIGWRSLPSYKFEDFRGATGFIKQRIRPDESLLLMAGHLGAALEYYYGGQRGREWHGLPDDRLLDVRNTLDYTHSTGALNAAVAGKRGVWLLLWQDDVVDPSGFVRSMLRRQAHLLQPALDTREFQGLRVMHFRFDQPYVAAPEALDLSRSAVETGGTNDGLRASGCAQIRQTRAGDGGMELLCFWGVDAAAHLPHDTQVSLRLFDSNGAQVAQSDQMLSSEGLPSIRFDRTVTAVYFLEIPDTLQAGDFEVLAIPYVPGRELSPRIRAPLRIVAR